MWLDGPSFLFWNLINEKINLKEMGMKWQVPDLCHVNGATWFSAGAVSHTQHNIYKCALSYFSKYTLRIIHGTLCLLYKAHIAQCAHFAMHRLSLTSVPYALCRMCFVPYAIVPCAMCHVPCAIVLCAMCHVPFCFVPCAMCHVQNVLYTGLSRWTMAHLSAGARYW